MKRHSEEFAMSIFRFYVSETQRLWLHFRVRKGLTAKHVEITCTK